MGADAKRKKRNTAKNDSVDTMRQLQGADNNPVEPTAKRFCLAVDAPKAFALVEKSRRARTSEPRTKSPVVLVRGLPENDNEAVIELIVHRCSTIINADLIDNLSRFGPISYVKCHFKQGWAFVEFEDEEGSEACVKYGYENAICIGGNEVFMMFSLHHILDRDALERREKNKVILMSVSNVKKEVKVQDAYEVCSVFGEVERIKISPISRGIETGLLVFVEFDSEDSAREAKLAVNGAFFYEGCNLIHCEYASVDSLVIEENTDHAHDYAKDRVVEENRVHPLVPYDSSPDSNAEEQQAQNNETKEFTKEPTSSHCTVLPSPPSVCVKSEPRDDFYVIDTAPSVPELPCSRTVKDEPQSDVHTPPMEPTMALESAATVPVQPPSPPATAHTSALEPAMQVLVGVEVGPDIPLKSSPKDVAIPAVSSAPANQPTPLCSVVDPTTGNPLAVGNNIDGPRCMMVYGIDLKSGRFNCDRLFNLMCMYGHVVAVKLVTRNGDAAIVEFSHPDSVVTVMRLLHNLTLFGNSISFDFGRNDSIMFSSEITPDGLPACVSYAVCPLQRFDRYSSPESSNKNRITAPTTMLYWWGAPGYTTKEMISRIFRFVGAPKPSKISPFPPGQCGSVGIVEFENCQRAAEALMLANHFPILLPGFRGPVVLKLTFASSKFQQY
ncbi:hypothetical protein Y032_0011g1344 [Ancylostoma ceylanicum]|uniref:RRM domain-containing protein n=1 Tax=Ancylostoma ceylanicum TaxID=53326 RepID=A0A016VDH7_9BILA|nr:hypothetical protein Y032_0011g1344 [Ancylostoma ceylanicum]